MLDQYIAAGFIPILGCRLDVAFAWIGVPGLAFNEAESRIYKNGKPTKYYWENGILLKEI